MRVPYYYVLSYHILMDLAGNPVIISFEGPILQ